MLLLASPVNTDPFRLRRHCAGGGGQLHQVPGCCAARAEAGHAAVHHERSLIRLVWVGCYAVCAGAGHAAVHLMCTTMYERVSVKGHAAVHHEHRLTRLVSFARACKCVLLATLTFKG
eukprot:1161299-Pelagomonas_calceolata.AAC.15